MVFKPRVLLGAHPNPRFLESRVGKTLRVCLICRIKQD